MVFMTFVLLYLLFLKRAACSGRWYNNIVTNQLGKPMSRYGKASKRMLQFLNKNPGATSGEVNDYLHGDGTITQVRVRYRYCGRFSSDDLRSMWTSKKYVLDSMMKSDSYRDVEILDERERKLSQISRGKFAYLLSPYYSRTLASDPEGRHAHQGSVNRRAQRKWFYRVKGEDGRFRYFLTLVGMAALPEHGIP